MGIAVPLPCLYFTVYEIIQHGWSQKIDPRLGLALIDMDAPPRSSAVKKGPDNGDRGKDRGQRIGIGNVIRTGHPIRPSDEVRKTGQGSMVVSPGTIGRKGPSASQGCAGKVDDVRLHL